MVILSSFFVCFTKYSSSSNISVPVNFIRISKMNDDIVNMKVKNILKQKNNLFIKKNIYSVNIVTLNKVSYLEEVIQYVSNLKSEFIKKENITSNYEKKYIKITKSRSISNNTYILKYENTFFSIAWITGKNFCDLIHKNIIAATYNVDIGYKLRINSLSSLPNQIFLTKAKIFTYNSNKTNSKKRDIYSSNNSLVSISTWQWPTNGKIIEDFSSSERGNKGIDIAGNKGQPVVAIADGRIVYVGNALRGYGNLIIIKHNGDYLSAYAHNDRILVKKRQQVKAGQKIATMGSTGTSSNRLHFEVRYKGKSVNPLKYTYISSRNY